MVQGNDAFSNLHLFLQQFINVLSKTGTSKVGIRIESVIAFVRMVLYS